jgi:prevent-host-death family protein
MTTITLGEMQQDLAGYLRRVQAGEILVVTDHNRPIAEIKPITAASDGQRPFGLCAGEFRIPDDFDNPLPDEVLREFGSL